jgi:hypothetical protein
MGRRYIVYRKSTGHVMGVLLAQLDNLQGDLAIAVVEGTQFLDIETMAGFDGTAPQKESE